jgi:hypothetical protein
VWAKRFGSVRQSPDGGLARRYCRGQVDLTATRQPYQALHGREVTHTDQHGRPTACLEQPTSSFEAAVHAMRVGRSRSRAHSVARSGMRLCMLTLCTLFSYAASYAAGSVADWLLGAVPDVATVTQGTLEGVPTLVIGNGLVQRTFAMLPPVPGPPPAPPPPATNYSKCPANCTTGNCLDGASLCVRFVCASAPLWPPPPAHSHTHTAALAIAGQPPEYFALYLATDLFLDDL